MDETSKYGAMHLLGYLGLTNGGHTLVGKIMGLHQGPELTDIVIDGIANLNPKCSQAPHVFIKAKSPKPFENVGAVEGYLQRKGFGSYEVREHSKGHYRVELLADGRGEGKNIKVDLSISQA